MVPRFILFAVRLIFSVEKVMGQSFQSNLLPSGCKAVTNYSNGTTTFRFVFRNNCVHSSINMEPRGLVVGVSQELQKKSPGLLSQVSGKDGPK